MTKQNRLLLLYILIFSLAFSLWSTWKEEGRHKHVVVKPQVEHGVHPILQGKGEAVFSVPTPATRLIQVETDLLSVAIDKKGGRIVEVDLKAYPKSTADKQTPVRLLSSEPAHFYTADTGFLSKSGQSSSENTLFDASDSHYQLSADKDTLSVRLHTQDPATGIKVVKQFIFARGKYAVTVKERIENVGSHNWEGQYYAQIHKRHDAKKRSFLGLNLSTYSGPAFYSEQGKYVKYNYKKMATHALDQWAEGGWVAMQAQYFISAWIPDAASRHHYFSYAGPNKHYTIGFNTPNFQLKPQAAKEVQSVLYAGPEIVSRLRPLAKGLDLTIDYGWLWLFSMPIFNMMQRIHSWVGNWGWSIILITLLIKLLFFKLSESSYRSMEKMKKLQPKIQAIQHRYQSDKAQLAIAMRELYAKEKLNPLGGCLPVLIQIPVFIALYYVLIESVELRQAPFMFWIHDLSAKDPYYVLPVLMGISMLLQQLMAPSQSADPNQRRIMLVFPVLFTALFINFPAGLVLYWLVNNCLSVLQQWYISRKMQ